MKNFSKFSILFFVILSCSNPVNNSDELLITGKVLNACNNQPIENIDVFFKAFDKYGNFSRISSETKTNSDGEFVFDESEDIESLLQGTVYVGINHRLQLIRDGVGPNALIGELIGSPINSFYSRYTFTVRTSTNINIIVELPPRKPVTIVAKPDTLKSSAKFDRIEISEAFGPRTGSITTYHQDSLNVLLTAGMTHSIRVIFDRNTTTHRISQDLQVNCNGTPKVEIYF